MALPSGKLMGFNGIYWDLMGFNGIQWDLMGLNGIYDGIASGKLTVCY